MSTAPGTDFDGLISWHKPLESVLACPRCHRTGLVARPAPHCAGCGFEARLSFGIPDFVDDADLSDSHRAELAAQANAAGKYYENEEKLSCHWDRISADELPPMLDWPRGQVLDLGCATGAAGAAFRRGGATVIGVDFSLPCLRAAEHRLDAVVRAKAEQLPFADGVFQVVVARGALHHFPEPRAALEEAWRVLEPGGQILVADPREYPLLERLKLWLRKSDDSFSEDHHAFEVEEYVQLVAERFEVVQTETLYPLGIMMAVGLDLLPLPRALPKRLTARALFDLDLRLQRTPLARLGHLLLVKGRKQGR